MAHSGPIRDMCIRWWKLKSQIRACQRYLKPIFEALNGEVPYDDIRIVLAHLTTQSS